MLMAARGRDTATSARIPLIRGDNRVKRFGKRQKSMLFAFENPTLAQNEGWATRDGGGGGHLWGSSRGGENSLRRPECGWGCRGPSLWLFFALWAQRTILTQDDKTRRRAFDFGRGVAHL